MSIGKSGQRQSTKQDTTQTNALDATTQEFLKKIMDAANAAGQAGPSPLTTGASDYYTGLQKAGQTGVNALSGDANAVAGLMNPFQQQVIDANNKQWGVTNAQTQNSIKDAATRAGAFGGSRAAVAQGAALSGNNIAQQGQTANLLQSGYNEAINRAGQLANSGFAGAGANANLGMGGVGSPQQWLLQMLNQGYRGPLGGTSSGSSSGATAGVGVQTQFDPLKFFGMGKS